MVLLQSKTVRKLLLSMLFVQSILFCTSCGLHSPSKLMKGMTCSEVKDMELSYEFRFKLKPQNIPVHSNSYGTWSSKYYQIKIVETDMVFFRTKLCSLLDSFKTIPIRRKFPTKRDNTNDINYYENNLLMDPFVLEICREKDCAYINIFESSIEFGYNPPERAPYITHSDPLWRYSDEYWFRSGVLQKALSAFANEIILYKNEQIKKDTTIPDSLKVMYPLVDCDSLIIAK